MTQNIQLRDEIQWIVVLRIIACFLVVMAHSFGPYVGGENVEGFTALAIWGSLCRPCVPLFIMISGVLLLPTDLRIGEFYSRRLKRILLPFIFWSILSPWMFYIFVNSMNVVNTGVVAENHNLLSTIQGSYMWLFNFSFSTIPYWYVYMVIGVYLIIPIISPWIKQATKKELQIVLGIWLFTTIIPYIQVVAPMIGYKGNVGNMGLYGECSWNMFTPFQYIAGYLGYVLFAHYLMKYPLNCSFKKSLLVGGVVFVITYLITLFGFYYIGINYPENATLLEGIWSYTGLNVAIMSFSLFIIFKNMKVELKSWVSNLSAATYGIFLVHFVVVHYIYELVFQNLKLTQLIQIPLVALISFIITALIVMGLRQIPGAKRFV